MGTRGVRVSVKSGRSKLVKWDDLRMQIISNPTHDEIKKAAKALKDGHLVAFPTETVYGLGADANNEKAVSRIYSVKGRPIDHPLIVHISSTNQLDKWAINIPDYALKLAKKFWPGPMTLILKRSDLAKDYITGGQDSVGLRVPNQSGALALLAEFESLGGMGVAAPSANKFMALSPTNAQAVQEEISEYLEVKDLILDGGQCSIGIESTIIDCTGASPSILRAGYITFSDLNTTFKLSSFQSQSHVIRFSGNFKKHYSPKAKVLLDKVPVEGQGFIALSKFATPEGVIRISSPTNELEFAYLLYESLIFADKNKILEVVVKTPSGNGLAEAIRDRLNKAQYVD